MLIFDSVFVRRYELNVEVVVVLEVLNEVDGGFSFLRKIDLVIFDFYYILMCKSGRDFFKLVEDNISDKIFGKFY